MDENNIISPAATFRALTRIESKQDLILERYDSLKECQNELKTDQKLIDDRIKKVETRINYWAGGLTVLIGILTFAGKHIKMFVGVGG